MNESCHTCGRKKRESAHAREQENERARERESERARERSSDRAGERGSKGARERGSEKATEQESERAGEQESKGDKASEVERGAKEKGQGKTGRVPVVTFLSVLDTHTHIRTHSNSICCRMLQCVALYCNVCIYIYVVFVVQCVYTYIYVVFVCTVHT